MNCMKGKGKRERPSVRAAACAVAVLMLLSVQVLGCGGTEVEKKQKSYVEEWTRIMTGFNDRVTADDRKANELVEQNDISGLIKLIEERIVSVSEVMAEVLGLYPPDNLQDLQATTLYYLATLRDQLEAQNDLNDAVLSGKPTQDLKAISESAAAKTQAVAGELGIEIQKAGIKMGEEEEEKEDEGEKEGEKDDETTVPGEPPREGTL